MTFQHFDRRQQRSRGDSAVGDIARNDSFRLVRVLADDRCGVLVAEGPAAVPRLAARSWRDMPFAPTNSTVTVANLNDDGLKLGEGAV